MASKKPKKTRRIKQEKIRTPAVMHIALCLIIIIATFAVYINTLHYPFQFDDIHRIENNQNIRSFSNVKESYPFFKGKRSVVNYTLWINYKLGEKNTDGTPAVEGMHIFNIMFHALNGVLVYFLACALIGRMVERMNQRKKNETPDKKGFFTFIKRHPTPFLAMFAGLIFTLHPVQTESVTYIITRTEILAAFFCLAGLLLYIGLVPSKSMVRFMAMIGGILVVYVLGLESKEWVPVLLLLMILIDYLLLSGADVKKFMKRIEETGTPIFIMLILTMLYLYNLNTSYKGDLDAGFGVTNITHGKYFLSQFNVLAYYIKLFLLPTNLRLDYDFHVVSSIAHFPTFLTLPFIFLLITAAVFSIRRSPMFSFAVLWFFITIAPTAGVIPISDLIFEHRLYMPMVGFSIFGAYFVWRMFQIKFLRNFGYITCLILTALITVYAVGTVSRNRIWSSAESLWEDSVKKSPNKARPHSNLGLRYFHMYRENGKPVELLDKAQKHLSRATELDPESHTAFHNIGLVYAAKGEAKLAPKKNFEKARQNYRKSIDLIEDKIQKAEERLRKEGEYDEAIEKALHMQLSGYRKSAANAYHDMAISYEHNDKGERYGVGFAAEKALAAYDSALEHKAEYTNALNNKAIVYIEIGEPEKGADLLRKLINITKDIKIIDGTYNKGIIEAQRGDSHRAVNYLKAAIRLAPDHEKAKPAQEYIDGIERR